MLAFPLDFAILFTLIWTFTDREGGVCAQLFVASVSAITTLGLDVLLISHLRFLGIPIAAILSALIVAGLLTAAIGTKLKQTAIISGIFTCVHYAFQISLLVALYSMFPWQK
jgi:hypothetical protein